MRIALMRRFENMDSHWIEIQSEGEEKSELTCVTPSCVQKNVRMRKSKLARSTKVLKPIPWSRIGIS